MNITKILNTQKTALLIVAVMLFSFISAGLASVSAATVTQRSIELSNSSASATGVTYRVSFRSAGAAGAFVVDFCSNTPVIGQPCTAPTGFNASNAASETVGFTDVDSIDDSTVVVTGSIAANTVITVELDGITNPSTAVPLYARVLTYANDTHADGYQSADPSAVGAPIDSGSIAISITDTIGVSGAVLESLLFCVSGSVIEADCSNTTSPIVELGEEVGAVKALIASTVSVGDVFTQISTNAADGAVVRLKSSAAGCGGLLRAGTSTCDIEPAMNGDIEAGQARFGVKTSDATSTPGTDGSGVFQPAAGSGYNNATFALNYNGDDETTGVTSMYGDSFLDTDGSPANNMNMKLTFGASVSNQTPAGTYSANLSLIATGKF